MRKFLEGYLHGRGVLMAQPQVYRSVAGNMVRLIVYRTQPQFFADKHNKKGGAGQSRPNFSTDEVIDWHHVQDSLSLVFGQFQSSGTSGRSRSDNHQQQGRVKTMLQVTDLETPFGNADIMAQLVAREAQDNRAPPSRIFDSLVAML